MNPTDRLPPGDWEVRRLDDGRVRLIIRTAMNVVAILELEPAQAKECARVLVLAAEA